MKMSTLQNTERTKTLSSPSPSLAATSGAAAAIDGMVSRIERELGVRAALIATGAHAARVIPHCERAFELDGHAALRGLALIWERNRRQRRQ